MIVPRFFILPGVILVATAGYITFGPGSGPVGQGSAIPTATAEDSRLIAPSPTANPWRLADPIPPGLSGRLTYRTGHDQVTVQFPDVREIAHGLSTGLFALKSADGLWTADSDCRTGADGARRCALTLSSTNGRTRDLQLDLDLQWSRSVQWSPAGHRLAILTSDAGANRIQILDDPDPSGGEPKAIIAPNASAFTWTGDSTGIIATRGAGIGYALVQIDANSGEERVLAPLREPPYFLYPSSDHSMIAFTGNNLDGWHLFLYDSRRQGEVRDLGPMGSDGPDGKPIPQSVPDVKTPMYIAWSPDGDTLAFGGGLDPPYVMTVIDITSGDVRTTQFADGYPGEIKWSPDGTLLAVSTYNIPRTHHESYVVDPATGIARDVLSGCVIVWSPDSRYLAIHGEREPGVAIADVATLEHVQLTHTVGDTPLRWDP